jgi:integrase
MVVVLRTKLFHRRILPMMTNEQVLQKMEEDFLLRDTPETTRKTYLTALKRFSKFVGKEDSLADLNEKDLRAFRVELLLQFFAHLNEIVVFVFFFVLYGTGMRTFELKNMKCSDIETDSLSGTRFVRISHGKRNKERMVILPEVCYQALRYYWSENRPETPDKWMFPAKTILGSSKCTVSTNDFKTCLKNSRLSSKFHPHSLRNSFSCHFIQNNHNGILTLQHLLGHASLASTEKYLPLRYVDSSNTRSPSEVCDLLWAEYKARHVDTKTF